MPGPDDLPRFRAAIVKAVVQSVDDSGPVQLISAQTHDGVVRSNIEVLSIHGHPTNPGVGAEAILLAIEGDQGHYVALPCSLFGWRFGSMPSGGAGVCDDAGNRLIFPGNGTGQLTTAGLFTMMVQSLLIQAQGGTTIHGPVTFTDPVTFAAAVTFQSDVTIQGKLAVSGAVTGASFNGHS